ncbi:hypothetical protein ACF08M_12970 [Streptomyces sp. NPDC015032]|uniref:hypothetical protein n=1 Tax=Streptomyces sp. NPDC015032 TaxID=3364937 RepID=UPI0036F95AB8
MSARDTLIEILRQWTERHDAAPQTPEALVAASDAELLREWSVKIREVGTAKGWSVWAAAYMDPDVEFVDTCMPSTETVVAELRRLDRVSVLREVDEQFAAMKPPDESKGTFNAGSYADAWRRCRAIVQAMAKEKGSRPEPEPLAVSRYDVAMEPASEEEPVFTVGAVAEDGRPVALYFDPETRRKVAAWLAPTAAELLTPASAFEVPDYEQPLSRANGSGDRAPITDTDVVDAIALGLGTSPEWPGTDTLKWIADTIGMVRNHPGDRDPREYREEFTEERAIDPLDDSFLAKYVNEGTDEADRESRLSAGHLDVAASGEVSS